MAKRHDTDALFKALADPSRRKLLDLLHAHDGRTLNELCEHLNYDAPGRNATLGPAWSGEPGRHQS